MSLETQIAVLFNDLQPNGLNRSIPILFSEISKANVVLFYRVESPSRELANSDLTLVGHEHASESLQRLYKIGQSYALTATKSLEIVSIADMFDVKTPATEHDRRITLEFGYRSVLSIPIMGKEGSPLGLIILFFLPVQTLSENILSNVSVFSRFCGIALDQSQLLENVSAQLPLFSSEKPPESLTSETDIETGQLGLLAASISHEVNNSLDGIKNYLYLISSETPGDHPHKEYLKIVETEIARTGKIVQQLSDLYQPGKTPKSSVHINEIIQSAVQLVDHKAKGKHYRFSLDLDNNLPTIKAVPEQLKSVFLNLFLNALQAMPQGGEINVKSELQAEPKKIRITVSDNGLGIPREHLAHVFQPFYTTKKGGTGLGLTICRQIIKSHNGTITVESLPEKGTQFIISLPLGE